MRVVVSVQLHPAPLHVMTTLIPDDVLGGGKGCCFDGEDCFDFAMCPRNVGGGDRMLAGGPIRESDCRGWYE